MLTSKDWHENEIERLETACLTKSCKVKELQISHRKPIQQKKELQKQVGVSTSESKKINSYSSLVMKFKNQLSSTLLLCFLLLMVTCSDQKNESFGFKGEWTIESYRIYTEADSEILNDQTFEDAGLIRFMNGGTGYVTIEVPGISLPPNQPVTWSYNKESNELTMDYGTGQDPFIYQVFIQPEDRVKLQYEKITQSDKSTSLFRTTIVLSKN